MFTVASYINTLIHFMCPPDWAPRCSDAWVNIILCVSGKVTWGETNMDGANRLPSLMVTGLQVVEDLTS